MTLRIFLLAACLTLIVGCKTVGSAEDGPATLRILSYNIHHGRGTDGKLDLERIAGVITNSQADLVALQEVDKNTVRTLGVHQAEELARLTGMKFVYGAAMPYQGGEYGQAILSRWSMTETSVHQLPQLPQREPRIAVAARIEPLNLWFVTTHLDHQLEDVRVQQAYQLHKLFSEKKLPVILAGDFNARSTSPTMGVFKDWIDAAADNPQPTIPSETPRARIDYILLRPERAWKIVETQVLDEPIASDHRPVLAVVRRKSAR